MEKFANDPDGYIRGVVLSIFVGGILGLVSAVVGSGINVISTIRGVLLGGGSEIASQLGKIGDMFVSVAVDTPISAIGGIAESAGVFAPLVSALIFAAVAAITAALLYATYRLVVIIT
ncbi:hypothetical protein [Halolamina salina]|uniref:Uncharacterized protein n=1 Tax=Halolamina salina TaxID=1220023 RepID=A0ABD6B9A4_9EURY